MCIRDRVWPALTRPDPPLEATGRDGLRIRLVQPPKALVAKASPLDVGLSETAQAMAKGREALFVRTPPVLPARPAREPAPPRYAPAEVAQVDDDDIPPPEPMDERWERGRAESGYELAQHRWDDEREARRERERRMAWEQDQRERRRWEEARERDRYDDRPHDDGYAPPPDEDAVPPPRRW